MSFHAYVKSFYAPGGVYDMGATDEQIRSGILIYQDQRRANPDITWGDGDSLDRERVRDIMIEKFGLTFPGE